MQPHIRVLLIEDAERDYLITCELLKQASGRAYDVHWVRTPGEALDALRNKPSDVCLLDYWLDGCTGVDFLRGAAALDEVPPVIILTGCEDPGIEREARAAGASDYLVKGQITTALLERSIRYACEKRKASAALSRSEKLLRSTLDALTGHIAVLDGNGDIVLTNSAWNNFATRNGLADPEFGKGTNYLDVCRRGAECGLAEAAAAARALGDVLAGVVAEASLEYSCFSDAEKAWFRMRILRLPGAHSAGAVVVHDDITARKQAEELVRAGERRFRALIENSADLILLVDASLTLTYASPSSARLLGRSPEELTGASLASIVLCDDAERGGASLLAQGSAPAARVVTLEARLRHRDGNPVCVQLRMQNLLADPDVQAIVVNACDITERKQAEERILETEGRYRELFDAAHDLVYTVDLAGRFTSLNRAAERAFGCLREEAVGMSSLALMPPEYGTLLETAGRDGACGRDPGVREFEVSNLAGRRLALEVSSTMLHRGGRPAEILHICRDVTSRRRAVRFEAGRQRILEAVAQNRPLEEILHYLADLVEQHCPAGSCVIRLLSGSQPGVVTGRRLDVAQARELPVLRHDFSQAPELVDADVLTPLFIEDAGDDADLFPFRGYWSFPLPSAAGRPLGTLTVYCLEPGLPDDEDQVLEKAAQLAALTIEHRQFTDRLAYQAQHDALTGLPNRLLLADRVEQALSRAKRDNLRVAILYLDLDNFKHVNDSFGHVAGDAVLKEAASRLRARLRETDTLARIGGDEFAIMIADLAGAEGARLVAQRLLDDLRAPFCIGGREVFVTGSVGISIFPRDGDQLEVLLQRADSAMYRVKVEGRNAAHAYSSSHQVARRRHLPLLTDLHRAVDRGELALAYQPQLDVVSGALAGFEVLLRWRHPIQGSIPASTFIPLAEESGLILPIGSWVLEEAARQAAEWQASGHGPVRLAINVSAIQFARRDWLRKVGETLAQTGISPSMIDLELTESVVMQDVKASVRSISRLRQMGFRISIDDFGTGYSSLAYLQRLPVDRLKIDVSFVREIKSVNDNPPVVRAMIELAHSLGIRVVGEGVETEDQLSVLTALGCDEVQGFLLARPATAAEATKMLRKSRERRMPTLLEFCRELTSGVPLSGKPDRQLRRSVWQ